MTKNRQWNWNLDIRHRFVTCYEISIQFWNFTVGGCIFPGGLWLSILHLPFREGDHVEIRCETPMEALHVHLTHVRNRLTSEPNAATLFVHVQNNAEFHVTHFMFK
jgi:hypothetical protein